MDKRVFPITYQNRRYTWSDIHKAVKWYLLTIYTQQELDDRCVGINISIANRDLKISWIDPGTHLSGVKHLHLPTILQKWDKYNDGLKEEG